MKLCTKVRNLYHEIIFAKTSIYAKNEQSIASLMSTERIVAVMIKL